jgi:hypothetical protein
MTSRSRALTVYPIHGAGLARDAEAVIAFGTGAQPLRTTNQ